LPTKRDYAFAEICHNIKLLMCPSIKYCRTSLSYIDFLSFISITVSFVYRHSFLWTGNLPLYLYRNYSDHLCTISTFYNKRAITSMLAGRAEKVAYYLRCLSLPSDGRVQYNSGMVSVTKNLISNMRRCWQSIKNIYKLQVPTYYGSYYYCWSYLLSVSIYAFTFACAPVYL
jgi:hypothetical protein